MIEVPASIGSSCSRAGAIAPVAVSPTGRWMFFVRPGDPLRPELAARLDVVAHGAGSWVPAPPTRAPLGRVRWATTPAAVVWRLPDSYAVQQIMVANLTPGPRGADNATALPRAA